MKPPLFPTDDDQAGWYQLLPPTPPLGKLTQNRKADVVIIGAGYAGLSAALRFKDNQADLNVVVLEASRLAWSASGRNSGFMIDLPHELKSANYASELDADKSTIEENRLAIDFAESVAQRFGFGHYLKRSGKYHGATNGKGLRALNQFCAQLDLLGEKYQMLSKDDMFNITGSEYYDGGIHTPGAALIQPAGYIQSFGSALNQLEGVDIYERSPAIKIVAGDNPVVTTPDAKITAKHVILANNGFVERFGFGNNRILHLFTYASLTEQLSEKKLQEIGGKDDWGLIPSAPMGSTLRKLTQGRFLIRNQWTFNPGIRQYKGALAGIAKQHDQCLSRRYPALRNVKIEHRWGGAVALTLNSSPLFGQLDNNIFGAAVCNGLGTTRSTLQGMMIADLITGNESKTLSALQNLPAPSRMPPPLLNKIGVPAYLKFAHYQAGRDL